MELRNYFDNKDGVGILSTSDGDGIVNSAIYGRPHVMEDGKISFIMADRLSHKNLLSNPHASYLFMEKGEGYRGKRLSLTKVREEKNSELLETLRRRRYSPEQERDMKPLYLVFFDIDGELPLVGVSEN